MSPIAYDSYERWQAVEEQAERREILRQERMENSGEFLCDGYGHLTCYCAGDSCECTAERCPGCEECKPHG